MFAGGPGRGDAGPPERQGGGELRPWWPLFVLGLASYAGFALAGRAFGVALPGSIAVGVPFLVVPILYMRWRSLPLRFGALGRPFLFSVASYAPFALWAALAAPSSESFYGSLAATVTAFPLVAFWAADTFLHVGAQDYFTKRVIQFEAELRYGPRNALALQLAAWSAGHVVEWLWLRFLLGDLGAAVFLVSAGFVTGLAYQRWKSASGLMVGHFLVNVTAALYAVALYG